MNHNIPYFGCGATSLEETENFFLVPGPSRRRAIGCFETSQITQAMILRHIAGDWNPQLQGNKANFRNAV